LGDQTSFRTKVFGGSTKSQFYLNFWRSNLILCETVAPDKGNRNFTSVFGDQTSFRAKRLRRTREIAILPQFLAIKPHFLTSCETVAPDKRNRNFTSVFGDQTSFRAKRFAGQLGNRTFTSVVADRTSFRARVAPDTYKSQILLQFLPIEPHFVRKGCARKREIAILPLFLVISCETVAFRAVSLALPRAFKRETEKKRARGGQESKRAREQEGNRASGQDVRM